MLASQIHTTKTSISCVLNSMRSIGISFIMMLTFVFCLSANEFETESSLTKSSIMMDPTAFITTWKTDNAGPSSDTQITIPTNGSGYDYDIAWEEVGNASNNGSMTNVTGGITIDFPSAGTYQVSITGDFPYIYFGNAGDREKILNVEQWGSNVWTSMFSAFHGCSNLIVTATDAPDLSQVTSLSSMFEQATSLNSDFNHWNVSQIIEMNSMFAGATSFNGNITSWNVFNISGMNSMFKNASSFNQNISSWNVEASDMDEMFSGATAFDQDLGEWSLAGVTELTDFLSNSGLSIANYDNTLIGWDSDPFQIEEVFLDAVGLYYSSASQIARDNLVNGLFWEINGDMLFAGSNVPVFVSSNTSEFESLESGVVIDVDANNGDGGATDFEITYSITGGADQTLFNIDPAGGELTFIIPPDFSTPVDTDLNNAYIVEITADDGQLGDNLSTQTIQITVTQRPFITIWKTDNSGTSSDTQISIPTTGSGYDYDIAWEEVGNASNNGSMTNVTGGITIDFPSVGTYQVSLTGDFPHIIFDNTGDKEKILSVEQWGDIVWASMSTAFYGCSNLTIPATDAPDLSNVTDMGGAFRSATSLTGGLSHWDVSQITNMNVLFSGASSFNTDLSNWDVSKVTTMIDLLSNTGISAPNYNAILNGWAALPSLQSNVTMGATGLQYSSSGQVGRDLLTNSPNNWIITGDTFFFNNPPSFTSPANRFFETLGIRVALNVDATDGELGAADENVSYTITAGADQSLFSIDVNTGELSFVSPPDFENPQDDDANNLYEVVITANDGALAENITEQSIAVEVQRPFITTWLGSSIVIPVEGTGYNFDILWEEVGNAANNGILLDNITATIDGVVTFPSSGTYKVSIIGDFPRIYFHAAQQENRDKIISIAQWGSIEWSSMERAFSRCTNLNITATDAPDLSMVTSAKEMFFSASAMNANLNSWDVSNITDMEQMFDQAATFNGDISCWDVGNVINTRLMFLKATAFAGDISNWDVSKVEDMGLMFEDATSFNSDLSNWDVDSVTSMWRMFTRANSFTSDLSSWNVSQVTDMSQMFNLASAFTSDLSGWDVSNVNNLLAMFSDATSFNSDLGSWNVSNVSNMRFMFNEASSFDSDLGSWDISNVSSMTNFFNNSGMSISNYNATLNGWAALPTLPSGVSLTATGLKYSFTGQAGRSMLTGSPNNWSISGDAFMIINPPVFTSSNTTSLGSLGTGVVLDVNANNGDGGVADEEITYSLTGGADQSFFVIDMDNGELSFVTPPDSNNPLDSDMDNIYLVEVTADDGGEAENTTVQTIDITVQQPFITTWKTDNAGSSSDTQITIPTSGTGYNYSLVWKEIGNETNKGSLTNVTGNVTIDFPNAGTYQVEISGEFPRISVNSYGDREKILSVEQWGNIEWTSMETAFAGCTNLNVNATDAPDLSQATSLEEMFAAASSLTSDLSHWDVSNITNMSRLFSGATSFNSDLASWNVSNVTDMSFMFENATIFNQDIGSWDVSQVMEIHGIFLSAVAFNQDITGWNLSQVTNMFSMFRDASTFNQDISVWDVSNVTNMSFMFNNATSFNQDISGWDVSKVTSMSFFMNGSGLSFTNYNALLNGWAALPNTPTGITMGAAGLNYTLEGKAGRDILTGTHGWNITGDNFLTNNAPEFFNLTDSIFYVSFETEIVFDAFANDGDGGSFDTNIAYSLSGVDMSLFTIDANTGVLNFTFPPDSNNPLDADNDNVYQVTITADDGELIDNTTELALVITVFTPRPFITIWKTDNTGPSSDTQITIPTGGLGYDYDLLWEEVDNPSNSGTINNLTGDVTVDFPSAGIYQVYITGDFPRIFFGSSSTDDQKILSVEQWGDIEWISMDRAFQKCSLLEVNATDAPNLSQVTSTSFMFGTVQSLNSDFNTWDVSNVQYMDGMFFQAANFNGDISNWDVRNVTTTEFMFFGATNFNNDIGSWDVSSVTNMSFMFHSSTSFNQDISNWDIANVDQMTSFLNGSGVSMENYNALLNSWAGLPIVQDGVSLGASGLQYSLTGKAGRDILTGMHNWNISGDIFYPNNPPVITSSNVVAYPSKETETILDIEANDGDGGIADVNVTYSITGGADMSLFSIDTNTGLLNFISPPNFNNPLDADANNVYHVVVTVDDGEIAENTTEQAIEISVLFVRPFITTWKTDNFGISSDTQITIPTSGTGYNYDIAWEEIGNATNTGTMSDLTGTTTVNFPSAGTYQVAISGSFPRILFESFSGTDNEKILSVEQWGDIEWTSMERAFYNCYFLEVNATDAPDLSQVTSTTLMFLNAINLNSDFNSWDVSSVVQMLGMFQGASTFNGDISNWDVSSVLITRDMFHDADDFNTNIGTWDVSSVTDMLAMFQGASSFNQDLNTWDVSNVDQMAFMFDGAFSFDGNITSWDVSNVLDMNEMFDGATNFNQNIGSWNTESLQRMDAMFRSASSFNQDISGWNVSSVSNFALLFNNASSFDQNLGNWDISSATGSMNSTLSNTGLSSQNYDVTLNGWAALANIPAGISLGAHGLTYSTVGKVGRDALTAAPHSWTITGDAPENIPPVFTSASSVEFKSLSNEIVIDVDANDGDASDLGITYSISGGVDGALFSVNSVGELTFVTPPDRANPLDADNDNVYIVDVTADDGEVSNNETMQVISITVIPADQVITFNALPAKALNDPNFELDATASSGFSVSYTSSNTTVATIEGTTVTIQGLGTTTITAYQAGSDAYNEATASQPLVVIKGTQIILFDPIPEQNLVETSTLELASTGGGSAQPVTYTSSNTAVATVDGSTVTLHTKGAANITANQAGNENFEEAIPVDQLLTVVEEYVWDGTTWNTSDGSTPPVDEDIVIEDDFTVSENGTFEAANLEVMDNVMMEIDEESAIVVTEDLVIKGDIELNSGGILAIFGDATGTGELVANRHVTPDLGYSVVGTTVGDVVVSSLGVAPDFFYGFDGTNFTIPTTLESGKGYFVAYNAPNPLFTLGGTPTTGEVSVTLNYSNDGNNENDFNLLSNPFNSAISRQIFVDNNPSIDGVTYYWEDAGANLSNGNRAGTYVTVSSDGTTTGGAFDGNIRSGQGFFVRATSGNNVDFDTDHQVTDLASNSDGGFFRTITPQQFRLSMTDGVSVDELIVNFNSSASIALDKGLDAHKFMNPGLSMYTISDETPLAIQALPEISEKMQIPIGYRILELGEVELKTDVSQLDEGLNIYLHDHLTKTRTDLRVTLNPMVTLIELESKTRFTLEISPNVLSVKSKMPNLIVYGTRDLLEISAEISGDVMVYIYGIDGKLVHREEVNFNSGNGILHPKLDASSLYILRVGDEETKFIIKDRK